MAEASRYQVTVDLDVAIEARDGIRLAADIYRPTREGRRVPDTLPVLLERTPYGKDEASRRSRAAFFARRGYAVVIQDCRGCFQSEGQLRLLVNEPKDGFDTVGWIEAQSWCNGKVGTYGTSYGSWVQSALATQDPPALACQVLTMGGWNAHTTTVRHGGAFELRFMAWAFWHSLLNDNPGMKSRPDVAAGLESAPDFSHWLQRLPIRRGQTQLSLVPDYEDWLFDIYTKADYDQFWRQPGFAMEQHLQAHADVPTLLVGGWYDSYTRATLDAYMALRAAKKGPIRVIMGPWTHGRYTTELSYAGDTDFGADSALASFDALHLSWFDRWLKEEADSALSKPVRLFVMGGGSGRRTALGRIQHGGRWREEGEWPLPRAQPQELYLTQQGGLSGTLPRLRESSSTYCFDPTNPVPTIGGNFSSLSFVAPLPAGVEAGQIPGSARRRDITPAGGFDQQEEERFFGCETPYLPLGTRNDVLVYQTPPLQDEWEVTGPIEVCLWVCSSTPDTDFTAKLIDVYPPSSEYPRGFALNLTDSIVRARYRNSREKGELMIPGEVVEVKITLYPISNLFGRHHRIRLDVSSSNFPRFDVNPNTGEQLGRNRGWRKAWNTVYHDRQRPSHLRLPVVGSEPGEGSETTDQTEKSSRSSASSVNTTLATPFSGKPVGGSRRRCGMQTG